MLFLPAVEVQRKTTTTPADVVSATARCSVQRKGTVRGKRDPTPKRASRTCTLPQVRTVSPGTVSSSITDSEASSQAGDSDTDCTLDSLFDMDISDFADKASTNSTVYYPVAALPTLEMSGDRGGILENAGDDVHSWVDILFSEGCEFAPTEDFEAV